MTDDTHEKFKKVVDALNRVLIALEGIHERAAVHDDEDTMMLAEMALANTECVIKLFGSVVRADIRGDA